MKYSFFYKNDLYGTNKSDVLVKQMRCKYQVSIVSVSKADGNVDGCDTFAAVLPLCIVLLGELSGVCNRATLTLLRSHCNHSKKSTE